MVTDIGQDYLDDGTERRNGKRRHRECSKPLPRLCDECKAVVPNGVRRCSSCGAAILSTTTIHSQEGELVELGSRRSGRREPTLAEKRLFLAELKGMRKPEWKPGWAAAKFREKFGHWPSSQIAGVASATPSIATRNWVKSRAIAWVKRRADV
jgi:hypothetical protein